MTVPQSGRRARTQPKPPSRDNTASVSSSVPALASPPVHEDPEPWLLRFDGACRRNPGSGGAGAVLFAPSGTVVWTCSHYLPSAGETNNSAEYTALLMGVEGALHHGATRLQIEGDSSLVLAQVRGSFGCTNRRLRRLRDRVRQELKKLSWSQLRHIDRQANGQADRLANRALDLRRTIVECGAHTDGASGCFRPPIVQSATDPPQASPALNFADQASAEGEVGA